MSKNTQSTSNSTSTNNSSQQFFQKWKLDFTRTGRGAGGGQQLIAATNTPATNLESPPGYVYQQQGGGTMAIDGAGGGGGAGGAGNGLSGSQVQDHQHLIVKRAWETALAPLKQLPMNLFIMYMAGNSISIFPIMMVGMMFVRPMKALVTVGSTFKGLEESAGYSLLAQKFIYSLGNLLGFALALYKCSAMGLLPTHESDWLAFAEPPVRMEYSGGGAGFY